MTELSGYVLETLRKGGEFILYRGRQRGNPLPVLVLAPISEQPTPASLRRLEHEYSLAAELDPAWAAQPLALTRHEGRTILVLKDPGGEPMDRILDRGQGQPLELTGRMNRSIDARSDLYSLGVTLYQMLTGALPFAAADPLEWIHCHIARQPTPPGERAAVPEQLSTLTMKLLAKNAEERYQTASGLEADLRRCLGEWESHGRIDPFPLCAHDSSDRLLIR